MTSYEFVYNSFLFVKMAVNKLGLAGLNLLQSCKKLNTYLAVHKLLYCTAQFDNEKPSEAKTGFAIFSEKRDEFLQKKDQTPTKQESFPTLLRNSKFIDLGDPVGKEVIGEIYHVVNDDLYIDFGWKFPTVCTRPSQKKHLYVPGAKVRLMIKELEISTKFLGSKREVTLQEADCVLLGLARKEKTK